MVAKDVSVGLTYNVMVSDKIVPVRLTGECPYGGWYGINTVTDQKVRIKTAGRLREQVIVNSDHRGQTDSGKITPIQESNTVSTTQTPTVTAADRRAKRAKSAKVTAPEPDGPKMADVPAKPPVAVKPTAVKSAAKKTTASKPTVAKKTAAKSVASKPASKPAAAKSAAKPTPAKPAAKKAAPAKPTAKVTVNKDTPTDNSVDIDKLAAMVVAKLMQDNNDNNKESNTVPTRKIKGGNAAAKKSTTTRSTAKPAAKRSTAKVAAKRSTAKVAAKPTTAAPSVTVNDDGSVTVILTALKETPNKFQFGQPKGTANPLVTGFYVTKEGIDALVAATDEDADAVLELTYEPHGGNQPKHSTRWDEQHGNDSPASTLYLMNAALSSLGAKEGDKINADVAIEGDSSIALTLWVA